MKLTLWVYCVVRSVIAGTLIGEDAQGGRFNVNEKLLSEGFAARVEENNTCKLTSNRYLT